MGPTGVDWLPALLVLGVGLALGAFLTWRFRKAGRAGAALAAPSLDQRDLAAKRDALLRQIRELEDTAAKRTPEQLARERYALELDAARVLQALAAAPAQRQARASAAAEAAAAPAVRAPASPLRGFLWGVGSMAALGALFFLVWQSARPREEGGSVTGNMPREAASPAADAEEARLRETIARNPDDVEARLDLARVYLSRQDMMSVFGETKYVLERAPGQPRALAYQALVRLAMGQSDLALDMLKRALQTSPDFFEGYIHLMLVHMRMGRVAEAEATAAVAARRFPEQAEMLRGVLAQMKQDVPPEGAPATGATQADAHSSVPAPPGLGQPGAAAETDPHAAVSPPGPGARASGTAAGASADPEGGTLEVEVDLDPALRSQVPSGAVLFVIVREAGMEKGPPRAVKRVPVTSFPVRVTLGEADSMAGEPLPADARVEARADSDGDPMTRPATDPKAARDGVKLGSGPVRLILKR